MNYREKVAKCYEIAAKVILEIEANPHFVRATPRTWDFMVASSNERKGKTRAKRSALGHCSYVKREIVIDETHVELDNMKLIEDTIRHEYAHAVASEVYHCYGHGRNWKSVAVALGATPRATTPVSREHRELIKSKKKYVIGYFKDKEFVEISTAGRKLKNLKYRYINGMKSETIGKLVMACNKTYREKNKVVILHG